MSKPDEDAEGFEERLLYKLGDSRVSDFLLLAYFVGIVISGLIGTGWLNAPGDNLTAGAEGHEVATYFSWATVMIGMSGVVARLFGSRMGEFYAILGIAVLTAINGLILLPDWPQTAVRLLVAPAMMVPYAWIRLGVTMSRGQVNALHRVMRRGSGRGER